MHIPQAPKTLADAMRARFREEGTALSKTWLEQVERYIRKVDFARLPVDVEGPALRDFLGTLAPVDANRARAAIGATLKFARLRRWISPSSPNPLEFIARNRESRQTWTAKTGLHHGIDEVVQQLSGEYIEVWQAWAIRILIWTGRRPTETLGAPATAVDVAAGMLRLPTTKIGRPQVVPLEGAALDCARQAAERAKRLGSPWLFPTTCRSAQAHR